MEARDVLWYHWGHKNWDTDACMKGLLAKEGHVHHNEAPMESDKEMEEHTQLTQVAL